MFHELNFTIMKTNIKRQPKRTYRPAGKRLTKSVFRQFNRKSRVCQENALTAIADSISRGGKAFIDIHDRVIVSRVIVGKVIIIVIPAHEVRGWCGNEPHPLPFPPPPPRPIPDGPYGPMPGPQLDKAQRQAVGRYLAATLKTHQDALRLATLGNGFHTIALGSKATIHVMGSL